MNTPSPVENEIKNEFRQSGTPPPRSKQTQYDTDDAMFKDRVITPEFPVDIFEDQNGTPVRIPKYVPTMTLGNLTWKEMTGVRYQMINARILERYGYYNISSDLHVKFTDAVITSQNHQAKMLTLVLTQQYGMYREEKSTQEPEDTPENERGAALGRIWDRVRQSQKNKPKSFDGNY